MKVLFSRTARPGSCSATVSNAIGCTPVGMPPTGDDRVSVTLWTRPGSTTNSVAPSIVLMAMDFGNAIIITAALSFLGLGAVPPTPEWGAMVAEGRELTAQWWISTFPGVAILMVALAANFVGDGLRDAIDPRLRLR